MVFPRIGNRFREKFQGLEAGFGRGRGGVREPRAKERKADGGASLGLPRRGLTVYSGGRRKTGAKKRENPEKRPTFHGCDMTMRSQVRAPGWTDWTIRPQEVVCPAGEGAAGIWGTKGAKGKKGKETHAEARRGGGESGRNAHTEARRDRGAEGGKEGGKMDHAEGKRGFQPQRAQRISKRGWMGRERSGKDEKWDFRDGRYAQGRETSDKREAAMKQVPGMMMSATGRRTSGSGRMNAGATRGGWGAFERAFACAVVAVGGALWVGDARSSAWGAEAA